MKTRNSGGNLQKKFDFSQTQQRPLLASLPAQIDTYEEGVARFFRWRTGLDYYLAIDQVVDFVVNTGRTRVVDLVTDTATFPLHLAARKAFSGQICSFDSSVTLVERAKQRAAHLNLRQFVDFRHHQGSQFPVSDGFCELAVSIGDLHRHPVEPYLHEILRILVPNGYLILAELLIPKRVQSSLLWFLRRLQLRYVMKNPAEASAVYYDQEDLIGFLFKAGFRQVIVQGLSSPGSRNAGVFSLIAATK